MDWTSIWRQLAGQNQDPEDPYAEPTPVGYGTVLAPENDPVTTSGGEYYPGAPIAGQGVLKPGFGLDAGGQTVRLNPTTRGPAGLIDPPSSQQTGVGQTPETQAQNDRPQTPQKDMAAKPSTWMTNAPDAMAKADREMRAKDDWKSVGNSVAQVVKMVAGAYGGGVGGTTYGAADGSSMGGSSPAAITEAQGGEPSFGDNFQAGYGGESGHGAGGFFGRLSGQVGHQYDGSSFGGGDEGADAGGGDGTMDYGKIAQLAQKGASGMGEKSGSAGTEGDSMSKLAADLSSFTGGIEAKRRSALARLGMLPEFAPQATTGDVWATGG